MNILLHQKTVINRNFSINGVPVPANLSADFGEPLITIIVNLISDPRNTTLRTNFKELLYEYLSGNGSL